MKKKARAVKQKNPDGRETGGLSTFFEKLRKRFHSEKEKNALKQRLIKMRKMHKMALAGKKPNRPPRTFSHNRRHEKDGRKMADRRKMAA